jgi:hypothetical protein
MVIMLPTKGYRKPAPTDALISLMGSVKPLGAPAGHPGHSGIYRLPWCVLACKAGIRLRLQISIQGCPLQAQKLPDSCHNPTCCTTVSRWDLPLSVASWLKLYCVLAMQMGSLSKPMAVKRCGQHSSGSSRVG